MATAPVNAQFSEGESVPCQKEVDALFDTHGPAAILHALSQRCKGESGIAHGEDRHDEDKSRERQWAQLANELTEIETPVSGG